MLPLPAYDVKIPIELFDDLLMYFSLENSDKDSDKVLLDYLHDRVKRELQEKEETLNRAGRKIVSVIRPEDDGTLRFVSLKEIEYATVRRKSKKLCCEDDAGILLEKGQKLEVETLDGWIKTTVQISDDGTMFLKDVPWNFELALPWTYFMDKR